MNIYEYLNQQGYDFDDFEGTPPEILEQLFADEFVPDEDVSDEDVPDEKVSESFEEHEGRPGQVGGSKPKNHLNELRTKGSTLLKNGPRHAVIDRTPKRYVVTTYEPLPGDATGTRVGYFKTDDTSIASARLAIQVAKEGIGLVDKPKPKVRTKKALPFELPKGKKGQEATYVPNGKEKVYTTEFGARKESVGWSGTRVGIVPGQERKSWRVFMDLPDKKTLVYCGDDKWSLTSKWVKESKKC